MKRVWKMQELTSSLAFCGARGCFSPLDCAATELNAWDSSGSAETEAWCRRLPPCIPALLALHGPRDVQDWTI